MNCKRLNICQYTPVRSSCDEYGVNARFNLLFKEVCSLKSTPYILPIASSTILGGIRVGSGLTINSSTGVLSATGGGGGISWLSVPEDATFEPDGVTLLNDSLSNSLSIFWNDINRYIYEADGEWQYVTGGIEILLPGFDATTNNYHLEIVIK